MKQDPAGIAALDERIPFLLSQLGSLIADAFQARMRDVGTEPHTYAVLMALATRDGQSQRELCAGLGIHRNAMVGIVDRLEAEGMAKRKTHPDDRRAFAVTLTDKARRLLPELDQSARALEDEVTAPLSTVERDVLRGLLQRVAAGAGLIPGVHPGLLGGAVTR
jgi:DNA-binding MarR family transcriptional regulator